MGHRYLATAVGFLILVVAAASWRLRWRAQPSEAADAVTRWAPVWATLTWSAAPSDDEPRTGPCEPAPVRLAVFPPGQSTQLSTGYDAGPVCDHGQITAGPFLTKPVA